MKKVLIKGALGAKYGKEFYFDVKTPVQALKGLFYQLKGFPKDFKEGNYSIFRNEVEITEKTLNLALSKEVLIIAPGLAGNATGLLIFAAVFAVNVVLGNPIGDFFYPKLSSADEFTPPDQRNSFLFNGAKNVSTQGVAVPLVYGKMRTGSVVVSAGINTEEV